MMNIRIKYIVLGIGIMNISSCMVYEDTYTTRYQIYTYDYNQMYPQADYHGRDYYYGSQSGQSVVVPDSYHVGEYHSPVSFKDRDRNWVNSQNPQGYTIQIADDEKASYVAQKLYKAPKNDRMAQVKYYQNGKTYYKGLYGTYDSPDAAQKALESLPPEIKQGAGIKNWGSIQGNLNE
ncbi:SPOR domain-containing protein [Legionella pneumophila]|nr:SPOR domain-containing protein [Legionella pneumophila]AMP89487.2 SPOR domain-containing protein [Legionella pneumophila subsp. pascullei]HAT6915424.1 SPOR domain-containing protein [Legionella pneumophila]HAT6919154.1 SPOR domain-containing protein [Legionella pneumophila]HAT6970640.1 SPOR domain-containing protein [Legionella pneumophila]HAU3860277.1 SPOR domain-containing protein [Legionella pneumophila]